MKLLSTDPTDPFIDTMTDITYCRRAELKTYKPLDMPAIFRNFTRARKDIGIAKRAGRPWYYMDCGYFGNVTPRKSFVRLVPNDIQHSKPRYDLPADRFEHQIRQVVQPHPIKFNKWKKDGRAILVAPAANKSCFFYGYTLAKWLETTIAQIKQYTDRPIIIRNRRIRQDRIEGNSIYHQFDSDNIFALVTYNSMAAVEAVGYGIPSFTTAPCAANEMCSQDLSQINTPYYPDPSKVAAWQHWLSYCQYHPREISTKVPWELMAKYNLR